MKGDPCSVCGSTDLNLVDGYYYCIECGTQDENLRETVVEHGPLSDGTFAKAVTKKLHKPKQNIEMSGEWHKWHAFNFILSSMADELVSVGAETRFKETLLWIWGKYIKMFQNTDDELSESKIKGSKEKEQDIGQLFSDSDNSDKENNQEDDDKKKDYVNDIKVITVSVLHSMLYAALNLTNSDIQLSHMQKFIRENRLSSKDCIKHIPADLKVECIPNWKNFCASRSNTFTRSLYRAVIMTLFKRLNLGTPKIPDMKKIVDRFITELCLPDEFNQLVYSLMVEISWLDVVDFDINQQKPEVTKIPDYEAIAMAYIVMALKICFGLDDVYEETISAAVDKINEDNNYSKSYKFDMFADSTDRLFSFNQWTIFLEMRRMVLSRFNLSIAIQNNMDVDDYAFLVQTKDRFIDTADKKVTDEVTMDIIKKILSYNSEFERCNIEFPATLTPLTTYTNIIAEHIDDQDLRLILCEDFSKYSLKYCTVDFELKVDDNNIIEGVDETFKYQEDYVMGYMVRRGLDKSITYVRNCENKNWIITKPPKTKHLSKITGDNSVVDEEVSDFSDGSNEAEIKNAGVEKEKEGDNETGDFNILIEEEGNIFDDTFDEIEETKNVTKLENNYNSEEEEVFDGRSKETDFEHSKDSLNIDLLGFDPIKFDREEAIKQLVNVECKKHSIPLPKEYRVPVERKRRQKDPNVAEATEVKRRKVNSNDRTEARSEVDKLVDLYNKILLGDIFDKEINPQSIHDSNDSKELDTTNISMNGTYSNNDSQCEISAINPPEDATKVNHDLTDNVSLDDSSNKNGDDTIDNPNFDENLYDVNQLYVKFRETELEEVNLEIDSDIDAILTKALDNSTNLREVDEADSSENEETSVKQTEEITQIERCRRSIRDKRKEKLVTNTKIKNYGYWLRHYGVSHILTKNSLAQRLFDLELSDNYPSNFSFLFHICCTISECSAIDIYTHLVKLEKLLKARSD